MDGEATAAARDLAHAFGAVHPEAGTLRAIQAVIDQLDNPSSFARNKDAYEKHGASQGLSEMRKASDAACAAMARPPLPEQSLDAWRCARPSMCSGHPPGVHPGGVLVSS